MATVPLSGTNVRVLSGVPFSNDYKHTMWFDTQAQQLAYFNGRTRVAEELESNFQRIEGKNYLAIEKSVDQLWGANYVMFQNKAYSNKWFFGFITKLEYNRHELTRVYFEIDVFQTWKFEMDFKPSFVVREHQRLFAGGQPIINTLDEGLNYGTEYDTVSVERLQPSYGFKWLVIVSKEMFHNDSEEDESLSGSSGIIGVPQPLSYYIVPFKNNNNTADMTVGSFENTLINPSTPTDILNEIRKNTKAVNNIVSMYVTDYTGLGFTYYPNGRLGRVRPEFNIHRESMDIIGGVNVGEAKLLHIKQSGSFNPLVFTVGDKYDGFYQSSESKLMMYPYCLTILDDFKGNRIEIKNEHIISDDLVIYVKGSLGHSNKTSYGVKDYNYVAATLEMEMSNEFALINSQPNDVPILNEMLAAFIQGNRNTYKNQLDSAVFNGVTGAIGSAIGTIAGAASGSKAGTASGLTSMVQGAGNSVLSIQGLEAKVDDIKNVPPSLSKLGGNAIYESGNGYEGLYIIKKQLKSEYRTKLEDFFNMFGYKSNRNKIPNFHTRRYWNYVQTESCNIIASINNEDLVELKKVFDNGITLWHTPDVGNYALENEVL